MNATMLYSCRACQEKEMGAAVANQTVQSLGRTERRTIHLVGNFLPATPVW